MMVIKLIVGLLVMIVLLYFAGENDDLVKLTFGPYETIPAPMYILVGVSLIIGMAVAMVISFIEKLQIRSQLRALRKEKKRMEGELNSLRKMPIVESDKTNLPSQAETDSTKGSE